MKLAKLLIYASLFFLSACESKRQFEWNGDQLTISHQNGLEDSFKGEFDTYHDPFTGISTKFPSFGEYYSANTGARYKGRFYAIPTRGLEASGYKFVDDYKQNNQYVHIVFIGTLYFNQLKEDVVLARENYIIGHPFIESTYASLVPAYPAKLQEMKHNYQLELEEHKLSQIRNEEQARRNSLDLSDLFSTFISAAAATYGAQYSDTSINLSSSEFKSNVSTNMDSNSASKETKDKPVAKFYLGPKESIVNIRQYCDIDSRRLSTILVAGDINTMQKSYTYQCYGAYPRHTGCEEQGLRKAISFYNKKANKFISQDCGLKHQPVKGAEK